jgi:hypothetical protein
MGANVGAAWDANRRSRRLRGAQCPQPAKADIRVDRGHSGFDPVQTSADPFCCDAQRGFCPADVVGFIRWNCGDRCGGASSLRWSAAPQWPGRSRRRRSSRRCVRKSAGRLEAARACSKRFHRSPRECIGRGISGFGGGMMRPKHNSWECRRRGLVSS